MSLLSLSLTTDIGESLSLPIHPGESLSLPIDPGESLSFFTDPGESLSLTTDPGESLSLPSDPGEFHTNWEERLWSDDKDNNDGLEDVLGSWTSMEDPEWIHDNPILLNDPFTMDLTEIAVAPELLLPESPDQTTTTTTTNPETRSDHVKVKVGRKVVCGQTPLLSTRELAVAGTFYILTSSDPERISLSHIQCWLPVPPGWEEETNPANLHHLHHLLHNIQSPLLR